VLQTTECRDGLLVALLRNELDLASAYADAVTGSQGRLRETLLGLEHEHRRAADALHDCLQEAEDRFHFDADPGPPGRGMGRLPTGDRLAALAEAEEQLLHGYERAMADEALPPECHQTVLEKLLPKSVRNLGVLGRVQAVGA